MDTILKVEHLKKYFAVNVGGPFTRQMASLKAVDDVSFDVGRGETVGLVGETGCGKTTVGRTIVGLYKPTAGAITYCDQNLCVLTNEAMRKVRSKLQMIFQDPYASLNPRMTVGNIIGEPMDIFSIGTLAERRERVQELLRTVGLNPEHANRFPHEFSGGQRQRIGIARALAMNPEFIIADEPISALDVSIQAQIVNMLEDLQQNLGLTYLFIAHDLAMVKHISDRVIVLYLGKVVEVDESKDIYRHPLHPYTKALLSAVPIPDPRIEMQRQRIVLKGDLPSPVNPPSGCHFRTRCPIAQPICAEQQPELRDMGSGHMVSCHFVS
ncbi:MAG: dipeptide ABC transporter ATP-binding protein [Caldiserica bacterium]|nr:dipeptide ABC transporter ATP-binding protein [Caldisericota bacterium]